MIKERVNSNSIAIRDRTSPAMIRLGKKKEGERLEEHLEKENKEDEVEV